jgi:coniferyl-aldehyde dehydrogenase
MSQEDIIDVHPTPAEPPPQPVPETPAATPAAAAPVEPAALLARQREASQQAGAPALEERLADLETLRGGIKAETRRIAAAISADFGNRSRDETLLADVWPALAALRHTRKHLKQWVQSKRVPVPLELRPGKARIIYQPLGVIGIISPWNYPFQLAIMPLIAAIAAGNRVMLKPSEHTPRTSELLAEFLGKLFPPEKVATVLGGPEVAAAFARLPFDHLFYTGSAAVGRLVMQAAAENLTPVTLELGGKSPCILGEDADLAKAVPSIAAGKLLNAGQTCIAPDYVLLPQASREEFIDLVGKTVRGFYRTLKANPDYTSIINDRQYQRLEHYVEEARAAGARVIEINPGNEVLAPEYRKLAPTLVIEPGEELGLMREEIFGPVLPVKSYGNLDEAIAFVNSRPRPLALYYFGKDAAKREEVLRRTISGGATIDDTLLHILVEDLPFGGVGASGFGAYHGEFGFQTFSHRRGVFVQGRFNSAGWLRPPFGFFKRMMIRMRLRR